MRIFDVELRFPSQADLLYVPIAAAGGTYLGSLIQRQTEGSLAPVVGMAAAAGAATLLALSGADLDAGWRGVALTLGAAVAAFVLATVSFLMLAG